ncbi:lysocardiolipin and lysophospholipid acyltransferase [Nematocida major]|uniref:lysocardiolipin and lysophospholipid acyltransferase n=1 Tax=Nematocida major TaxID=1912982 RepID=UPI002007BFB9|nr:lysocardiolipin and lysophospholipid acyltransferase [Nematocida major]KAH9385645.1 lysocardiolipin and lysophospholipid acyltransferase [Nematocida major]
MSSSTLRNITSLFRTLYFSFALTFYLLACIFVIPVVYTIYGLFRIMGFKMEKYKSMVGKLWLRVTESLLCILIGDNTYIVYKEMDSREKMANSLIISNHTSYVDWIYLWSLLLNSGRDGISFIAKEAVGAFYPLKLGMDMLNFVLLSRKMEEDKKRLKTACAALQERESFNLVIFPEGTFIDKDTKERDISFLKKELKNRELLKNMPKEEAEQKNIHTTVPNHITTVFEKVIFPRVKGFKLLLDELKDSIKYIIDCTIYLNMHNKHAVYPSEHFTLYNILLGRCSRMQALIVCENIELTPEIIENPEKWMYARFEQKDKMLKNLRDENSEINRKCADYKQQGYTIKRIHPSLSVTILLSAGSLATMLACSTAVYFLCFFLYARLKSLHDLVCSLEHIPFLNAA